GDGLGREQAGHAVSLAVCSGCWLTLGSLCRASDTSRKPGGGQPADPGSGSAGTTVSQIASATSSLPTGPTVRTSAPPGTRRCTVLSSWPKVFPVPTSLATSRSHPLRASLARAWWTTSPEASPVSAANPTT